VTAPALSTEQIQDLMPFARHLGLRVVEASPDQVVGELTWDDHLTTGAGIMHGGALMTLADSIGAACAFLNLPPGSNTSTTSSSTVFLRGVRSGVVTATARPLHVGRSTIAVEVELVDEAGGRVAKTTQSQAVLGGGG
jgi:uncharacterized protein (TIGR00369 family)